jgi:hypothetical protein
LKVGIAVACALIGLMAWAVFVPATPRSEVVKRAGWLKDFRELEELASPTSLVVAIESPTKITVVGSALVGSVTVVGSVDEFSQVVRGLRGPGTAWVLPGPSSNRDPMSPTEEIVRTRQQLVRILAENGFRDRIGDRGAP